MFSGQAAAGYTGPWTQFVAHMPGLRLAESKHETRHAEALSPDHVAPLLTHGWPNGFMAHFFAGTLNTMRHYPSSTGLAGRPIRERHEMLLLGGLALTRDDVVTVAGIHDSRGFLG